MRTIIQLDGGEIIIEEFATGYVEIKTSTPNITLNVVNAGIPGLIGPNIEFNVIELIKEEHRKAKESAS